MDRHRMALVWFTVAVAFVIVVASVTTLERVKTHRANNERPAGTIGLAKPHQPLDLAPGEPLPKER
jgi:hypothetical protein